MPSESVDDEVHVDEVETSQLSAQSSSSASSRSEEGPTSLASQRKRPAQEKIEDELKQHEAELRMRRLLTGVENSRRVRELTQLIANADYRLKRLKVGQKIVRMFPSCFIDCSSKHSQVP